MCVREGFGEGHKEREREREWVDNRKNVCMLEERKRELKEIKNYQRQAFH